MALSGPQGRNWLTLSTLKQGAMRVDRLPQEASGRWYLRNLARLVGAAFQLFDIHAMGSAVCNKAETARQCTLARPKIPSPCHKAETRQRDQGFNSDKEGQRGRGTVVGANWVKLSLGPCCVPPSALPEKALRAGCLEVPALPISACWYLECRQQ
jgi:hypothetical protein